MKKIIFIFTLFLSVDSFAARKDCGYINITYLYSQASRADQSDHSNKALVKINNSDCPGFGYINNDDPAFDSIFSMLLAAKMTDKKIRIVVNNSNLKEGAGKIEWVNFN